MSGSSQPHYHEKMMRWTELQHTSNSAFTGNLEILLVTYTKTLLRNRNASAGF